MLANLLKEGLDVDLEGTWENERTATPVRAFAVRLHAIGCSLRETKAILSLFGVERTHQAIFQ
ncbi:hypothetical protein GCM10009000_008480 [Halobacterium noricense]|uniref:Transposase n=1 Tax=Haladaptatus pallidirubidus TaxID=1008152 RepID=A0AAV3UQD6_9EURY